MITHVAVCEWDPPDEFDPHGRWAVHVEDIPGANSQVRRLDQVPENIAEAIELMTGETPESYNLEVRWVIPDRDASRLAEVARQRREVAQTVPELTREAARALRAEGFTIRDIGVMLGVSHQRAQKLLASAA